MAQVYPFRAYRYNPAHAPLERVLTQPYDKISPAMQEKYYAADPHNLIAIEKGHVFPGDTPQNNVYTRAAAALQDWVRNNIVVQDPAPSFYAYTQEYTVPGTEESRTRQGFIGLGKLEEYSAGVVFRHEQTLSGPKADRLELLRHTHTQTGQLFMLYSDAQRRIDALLAEAESAARPTAEMRDEYGVVHRLWPVAEPQRVAAIQQAMADQKLVIADGHHRYETALNYRNECRARTGSNDPNAPYERTMMTFINACSEGLTILATHRLVSGIGDAPLTKLRKELANYFDYEFHLFKDEREKARAYDQFHSRFEEEGRQGRVIGVYAQREKNQEQAFHVFTLKPDADLSAMLPGISSLQRELDVVLLHQFILDKCLGITKEDVTAEKHLTYERERSAAIAAVDRGAAQIAFLLNPVNVEQVMRIATAGEVMPQKSTDFFPKLMSGITMYRLDS
jgi:uncharacterized protein (DUF1015 family)